MMSQRAVATIVLVVVSPIAKVVVNGVVLVVVTITIGKHNELFVIS